MLKPSSNIITTPHKSYYSVVIAVAKRAREIGEEAEDVNLVTDVIRRQSEAVEDVFVETANRKILRWKGRLENGKQG